MRFATQYNFRDDKLGRSAALGVTINKEPDMTQQSDLPETDINVIMKRYGATGQIPQVSAQPSYGDFSIITDYRSALDAIRHADEQFSEVPAEVRARFDNDASKFIEFAQNPDNIEQMRKWKLAPPAKDEPIPPPQPRVDSETRETYYGDEGETSDRSSRNNVTSRATGYGQTGNANTNVGASSEQPAARPGGQPGSGSAPLRYGEGIRPYGAGEPDRGRKG